MATTPAGSKESYHWFGSGIVAGSCTVIVVAGTVESGNGSTRPDSSAVTISPGHAGTVDGTIFLEVTTSIRSTMDRIESVARLVAVLTSLAPSTWTVLSRVSSCCVWVASVVTTNGMVAAAPGAIEPVNCTVKPVTGAHPPGGSGNGALSVSGCGLPGVPLQTKVTVPAVAPLGKVTGSEPGV